MTIQEGNEKQTLSGAPAPAFPHQVPSPSKASLPIIPIILVAALFLGAAIFIGMGNGINTPLSPTALVTAPSTVTPSQPLEGTGAAPPLSTQLTKAKYLKEVYKVDRSTYDLFEKAAEYRKETLDQTKVFFLNCCDLTSESDIFSKLPPLPSDFAEVGYDMATGRLYNLAQLSESYYKQPEFYFNGLETSLVNRFHAFNGIAQPQLNYWGDYGLSTMPGDQSDTVSKSKRDTFDAVVFVTNGWNIQNYVGMTLIPNAGALPYFDITISEEKTGKPYFLLGPTFPRFENDWATKISIQGKVKPSTPPGTYTITINPISPPSELNQKWSGEHRGVYSPYGAFAPSGGYITFTINVEE